MDTPCDVAPFVCPFLNGDTSVSPMYFCRDNCGLGVDENFIDEPEAD
jgi:hypothetical protein